MDSNIYDKTSVNSIVEFARGLINKSLAEVAYIPLEMVNSRNRGDLGSLIERYFFEHVPANNHDPDFPHAELVITDISGARTYVGLELKTTGLVKTKDSGFKAKERLVLTMINYESIVNESWENSSLRRKCRLMLILFYKYEKESNVVDRKFVLEPLLYELEIPENDLNQIRQDWEWIKNAVKNSRAHELSEGDTFYLGACRKGAGGPNEKLVRQPNSDTGAKSRAFAFKASYLNKIINDHFSEPSKREGDSLELRENLTIAISIESKFKRFLGLSTTEIAEILNYPSKGKNHKGFRKDLANRILSPSGKNIIELEKAGIELKTIRLKQTGVPREAMSFPGFKFHEIVKEEWESSSFCSKLESKFLFAVFKEDELGVERLYKVAFWNMPYLDREEARTVWENAKFHTSMSKPKLFPKESETSVAHVRPKGKDGSDKGLLPDGSRYLKQCFWLNKKYIAKVTEGL